MDVTPDEEQIPSISSRKDIALNPSKSGSKETNQCRRTLRKRKSLKKSPSQIWHHVTEEEMKMTSLPASECKAINQKTRLVCEQGRQSRKKRPVVSINDGFCVRSDIIAIYDKVDFRHLYKEPSSMCPSPEDHAIKVLTLKHELSVSCPTCWSVQRNA